MCLFLKIYYRKLNIKENNKKKYMFCFLKLKDNNNYKINEEKYITKKILFYIIFFLFACL